MPQASGVSADITTAAPQPSRQVRTQNSGSNPAEHSFSRVLADSHGQSARPERTARTDHASSSHRASQSRRAEAQERDTSVTPDAAETVQADVQDNNTTAAARDDRALEQREAAQSSASGGSDQDHASAQQDQDTAADMLQRLQASRQMADSLEQQQPVTATVSSDLADSSDDVAGVSGDDDSSPEVDSDTASLAGNNPDLMVEPAIVLAAPLPAQATIAAGTGTASVTDSTTTDETGRSAAVTAQQPHPADTAGTQAETETNADLAAPQAPELQADLSRAASAKDSVESSAISAALSAILDKKSATDGIDPLHARLQQMAEGIARGQSARHLVPDDVSTVPMTQTAIASAMQSAMQQKNATDGNEHNGIEPTGSNPLPGMEQIQTAPTDTPTASELALAGQSADKLTPAQDDAQKITTKTPVLPSLYLQNAQPDEQALGARILMMAGQKWHEAELELEPQGMGKLKIQLTMDAEQQTNVQFIAQQAHVKEMLEQSLPKFREWLNQNGFQAGQTQVQTQSDWSGQQSQTFGQNGSDDSRSNTQAGYQNGTLTETENASTAILAKVRGNQVVDFYA